MDLDEITDINDITQLADSQMNITEELLELVSLKGTTTIGVIKDAVINCPQSHQVDLKNHIGIVTSLFSGWKKC